MIRPIVHDPLFLAQKSAPAKKADLPIVTDLMDTLKANLDHCVGMERSRSTVIWAISMELNRLKAS